MQSETIRAYQRYFREQSMSLKLVRSGGLYPHQLVGPKRKVLGPQTGEFLPMCVDTGLRQIVKFA